jgi:hypothetical protein
LVQRSGKPVKAKTYVPSAEGFARLSPKLSERIIGRLMEAESHESQAHLRDDYRIAAGTVFNCYKNIPDAWERAFREYLGKSSSRLIPFFVARAEWWKSKDLFSVPYPELGPSTYVRPSRSLQVIVERIPQDGYFTEKLACGHEHVSYSSVPSNVKRRNCSACAVAEVRSTKKPPQSVREAPKRGRKSA